MMTAATQLRGYRSLVLDTYEQAICEAWDIDLMATIAAVDARLTNTLGQQKAAKVYPAALDIVVRSRKNRHSSFAICLELRELVIKAS